MHVGLIEEVVDARGAKVVHHQPERWVLTLAYAVANRVDDAVDLRISLEG